MCERYSWIKEGNQVIFLTADDVFDTKAGKELQQYCGREEDYVGHGAIRHYYNFTGGIEKECTDFTTPANFPKKLVQAILTGKMVGLGVTVEMLDIFMPKNKKKLLQDTGLYKAWAARDKARAAYNKAETAYDKAETAYDKARTAYDKAWAAYAKARTAYDKAETAKQSELIAGYKKLLRNKKNLKKCWRDRV